MPAKRNRAARAGRVELRAGGDAPRQLRLNVHVDILQLSFPGELARFDLRRNLNQSAFNRLQFGAREGLDSGEGFLFGGFEQEVVDPLLFGRVIDLLARSADMPVAELWRDALGLLGLWAAVGIGGIAANIAIAQAGIEDLVTVNAGALKAAIPGLIDQLRNETAGLGGFAMAAAPAIVGFVGGTPADAIANMRVIESIYAAAGRPRAVGGV